MDNKILSMDFPYYKYVTEFNKLTVLKLVKNLKPVIYNYVPSKFEKLVLEKYENNYFFIYDDWNVTQELNSITNFFSEKIRIKCEFKNNPSPLEYWNNNKQKIIESVKNLTVYNVREYIFFNTKLCNNFRISLAITILNQFRPKKWLDISAGWGDRLLSAILYGVDLYVAADPNLELHPCYNEMITTFVESSKQKNFIILPTGFEIANLPNEKFDIVFTSPPFFDLEKYSEYENDSLTKYNSEKKWCKDFFLKSLIKSYNYLKKNGHILLYMSGSKLVISVMHKLDKIMKYKGVIYFYDNAPRPIYIWEKIKDNKIRIKN
jgi:hypothetical protein